ncbi:alpha/beta-hydrolase [Calocera viscosa TUFC12733]|uniref:Dipeptidyl-peptidase V n=1 Tax=Calocera viscosa (strain TUFC12733) TaxID=1330018 RepID=A0A167G6D9_CALVF|nr:alpha/beta-hydrolase [Calocera viscosa TUFC12733]
MSLDKVITGIASASVIRQVVLSPSATQVIYHLSPQYRLSSQSSDVSSLWISDLSPGSKSRRLTSGEHNDASPTWSTDETEVYFLSDRHEQDGNPGPSAIYALSLKAGGEAYALSSTENKSAVGEFWLSPDGRCIAYTAAREPTEEEKRKEKEKDDPIIFGDRKGNAQLWLLNVATQQVRRLPLGAKDSWHVLSVAWSPDSRDLMVMAQAHPSVEFRESPVAMLRVSVLPTEADKVEEVCTLPRMHSPMLLWPSPNEIALVQSFIPEHLPSSATLFFRPASSQGENQDLWKKYYGDVEDNLGLSDLRDGKTIAAAIAYGVQTRIDLIDSSGSKKALWKPNDEAPTGVHDVKRNKNGEYVIAMVVSSGPRCEPAELWAGLLSVEKLEDGALLKLTEKLSSHNSWADELPRLITEVVTYKAQDGTSLEGVITWLKDKEKKALPTVLFPHGGPYYRDTPSFNIEYYWGREILAFAGYLVLCPQYRGSMGRGHDFARCAHAQMGTHDWTDCYDLLQHAISQGWADKDKLGLAGWSQGGFLTAWGVSQTKDLFKAAMMGSGISDWGALAIECEEPDFLADLAGSWPWSETRVDHKGSPIVHVKGVKTPVLILHGQEDPCVPVAQGIGFHRGLRRASGYPDNHQLVIYPREGHMFTEQKHAEDAMRRMIEHMDAYLK